jgi:hypothetical protein
MDAASRVLRALLEYPIQPEQVRDRAIGLGLLRHPPSGEPGELTTKAFSRLLLVGYHLPALADVGTLPVLADHLRAGRRAFVLLSEAEWVSVCQLLDLHSGQSGEPAVTVREAGTPFVLQKRLTLEGFADRWAAVGNALIIAAASWEDLLGEGPTFFGGLRDRDGTYHWFSAECDTDAAGNIARC